MSSSDRCCPTDLPAVKADYAYKGVTSYEVGCDDSKDAIIFIQDIFGMLAETPQVFQVADLLNQAYGARVVVPDFFKGKPWPLSDMPPKAGWPALKAWISSAGNYDSVVLPILKTVIAKLKKQGVARIGIVGFCWGAKMAIKALQDGLVDAMVGCHPSFLEASDFAGLKGPVALLLSKDEGKLEAVAKVITEDAAFGSKSLIKEFPTMPHGFMAARGDWSDAEHAAKAHEGIKDVANFFKSVWGDAK